MAKDKLSAITYGAALNYAKKRIDELQAIVDTLSSIHRDLGVTTTPLTDGATTNPIMIDGVSTTAIAGDLVFYNGEDFVYSNEGKWMSVTSAFGHLAYKNTANGDYTPAGSIALSNSITNGDMTITATFTGTQATVEVS